MAAARLTALAADENLVALALSRDGGWTLVAGTIDRIQQLGGYARFR